MIGPLQILLLRLSEKLQQNTALRLLCYALMSAAIFAAWLLTEGDTVAFVYSEF